MNTEKLVALVSPVLRHAAESAPAECCGVVIVKRGRPCYIPCRNRAGEDSFEIEPADWAAAEDQGEIVAVCHSHVYAPPTPSMADLAMCERTGLPWLIVNYPTGAHQIITPSGWTPPLIGREFHHGVLDCYSLVRDYYATIGIVLPDFDRSDEWWVHGGDLYRQNFEAAGFVMVGDSMHHDLRANDGVLLQIASPVPNHAGVLLGNGHILQHCYGRLSSRDVYGGFWRDRTTHVLRHKSLL
jgi:proteasome lid subunit RPN8/RPN11